MQPTTPEEVAKESPPRNSPRFVAFIGERQTQYYVLVEQKILCQVPSFQDALLSPFLHTMCFTWVIPLPLKMCTFFRKIMCWHTLIPAAERVHTWPLLVISKKCVLLTPNFAPCKPCHFLSLFCVLLYYQHLKFVIIKYAT